MKRAGERRGRPRKARTPRLDGTLWGPGLSAELDRYTVGEDRLWDARLLPWDIYGSLAHAEGLAAMGLLSAREAGRIRTALRRALELAGRGGLGVAPGDEDAHTALEHYLTSTLGPAGEKIHAGRSRNDQVLAALRLYCKERLFGLQKMLLETASLLVRFGKRHAGVLMPGYTHQRRAMPSSVGLWAGGLAEALLEDLGPMAAALELADRSPLGSGAGYGVPLALPRAAMARRLGFAALQVNATAAQAGRGKLETFVLAALWPAALDLSRLAWDVILYTAEEFGFLVLPEGLATGSSIMPHKRNPDLLELLRGRAGLLEGYLFQAMGVAAKLPGGYHRDLQLAKGPLMRGIDTMEEMFAMAALVLPALGVDRRRCRAAVSGGLLATDEVYRLGREGLPFRRAYGRVKAALRRGEELPGPGHAELLRARSAPGGAGDTTLGGLMPRIASARRRVVARERGFRKALAALAGARRP